LYAVTRLTALAAVAALAAACVGGATDDPSQTLDGAAGAADSAPWAADAAPGSADAFLPGLDGGGVDHCAPSSALVGRVNPARVLADLEYLVGMGERRSYASQQAAADYIRGQLSGLPGVTVADHTYSYGGKQYVNVEATIAGVESPGEYVIFGAHYDSTSNSATSAPGADDNASGTTALMEMTRAFAGCAPKRSIRMVFFSNEEIGTVGSQAYAASLRNTVSPDRVVGVIVADMIGYGPADEDLDVAGRTADTALVNATAGAVESFTSLVAAPRIDDYCG